MMLVDSHCHLDCIDLSHHGDDLAQVLQQAHEANVGHMLCVSINLNQFPVLQSIADQYPHISLSVGLHPTEQVSDEPSIDILHQLSCQPHVVAIGETGLDYHHKTTTVAVQQERFRRHIRAARMAQKPLIVHTREARADTISLLKEEGAEEAGGVLHCFTENWEMAKEALDLGFYISFSGILTFKNATIIQSVAKKVPLDRILIETDSPYLAPHPYRGKPNQPAYVQYVASYLSQLKSLDIDQIAQQTTDNFFNLFTHAKK